MQKGIEINSISFLLNFRNLRSFILPFFLTFLFLKEDYQFPYSIKWGEKPLEFLHMV